MKDPGSHQPNQPTNRKNTMTLKDIHRAIDVMRIALDLPTRAERMDEADRLMKAAGMEMHPAHNGVLIRLRDGSKAFISRKALTNN
ncbi:hypothetical protein WIT60_07620 [Aquabacterium sp. G14]|uniref:hypothetical protein n=1 Tax=Aquabacterium sp. G14 TaxID=3130164 RepID=UPI0030B35A46